MNSTLAKQLKDSGFPQTRKVGFYKDGVLLESLNDPTLEELIEACGDTFWGIRRHPLKRGWWRADIEGFQAASIDENEKVSRLGEGQTPTEAVARLWLSIQSSSKKN